MKRLAILIGCLLVVGCQQQAQVHVSAPVEPVAETEHTLQCYAPIKCQSEGGQRGCGISTCYDLARDYCTDRGSSEWYPTSPTDADGNMYTLHFQCMGEDKR